MTRLRLRDPDVSDPLLRPSEAAKRLGVHRETIKRWMREGVIQHEVHEGRACLRESEVESQLTVHPVRLPGREAMGVYFILTGGFIKIGISCNVRHRLRELAKGIRPYDVNGLGFIRHESFQAAEQHEAQLHERFRAHHYRYEWFLDCGEIRDFIATQCVPWPVRQ
jgi:excisionase family DNA binding protein